MHTVWKFVSFYLFTLPVIVIMVVGTLYCWTTLLKVKYSNPTQEYRYLCVLCGICFQSISNVSIISAAAVWSVSAQLSPYFIST